MSSSPLTDYSVVIIGAGFAGLGAAQVLRGSGKTFAVLEAQARLGGRCFCDNSFPAPFDFGGQFFHQVVAKPSGGTNNVLYDIYTGELGKTALPVTLLPDFYKNGSPLGPDYDDPFHTTAVSMAATIETVGESIEGHDIPDQSLADTVSDFVAEPYYTLTSGFLELVLDGRIEKVSTLDAWDDQKLAIRPDLQTSDYVNPTGMGNFLEFFTQGLEIQTETIVTDIDLTDTSVIRIGTNRGTITATKVIVTIPMNVLARGNVAFRGLPPEYQQAFHDLPMGLVDKIGLAFDYPVFDDVPMNKMVTQFRDNKEIGLGLAHFMNYQQMTLIVSGDTVRELEREGIEAFKAYARGFVSDTFGSAAPPFSMFNVHPWGTDQWSMGSYSSAGVGKVPARKLLSIPVENRLYFAGEAVSLTSHSSLHGAFETGTNAALDIVGSLKV